MSYINWIEKFPKKSKTDIFLSNRDSLDLSFQETSRELEDAWFKFILESTPNGKVLENNSYKKALVKKEVTLIHVTPSLSSIVKTGKLLASGGGLGSAVYCCPVYNKKIHNLTKLYLNKNLAQDPSKKLEAICIKIKIPKKDRKNISSWGIDYTNFGEVQLSAWDEIKRTKQYSKEVLKIEEDVTKKIWKNIKLLNRFLDYKLEDLSEKDFEYAYNTLFNNLKPLRFILYEVLSEYILFYQDDKKSIDLSNLGELNNYNFKIFLLDLCPNMIKKFSMINFFIPLPKIKRYLKESKIISNFDEKKFYLYLKWRIAFYLRKIIQTPLVKEEFKNLSFDHPSLVGQMVYRLFPNRSLFEDIRSRYILCYLDQKRVILPIYPLIPKGEMGINPDLKDLKVKYKIYFAKILNNGKVSIGKELNIKITNSMVPGNKLSFR